MDNDHLLILIEKYLNGEATPAEQRWVENWYASFDKSENWLEEYTAETTQIKLELKQSVGERLAGIRQLDSLHQQVFTPRYGRYLKWAAAAAILVLIGSAAAFFYLRTPAKDMEVLAAAVKSRTAALPDGSVVTIQPGSQISFEKNLPGNLREIILEGNASFDVAAASTPFVVVTGNVATQVLGTIFNVATFPGADSIMVTVLKGKVRVSKAQQVLGTLVAGDRLLSGKEHLSQFRLSNIQLAELENGELQFDKQTLAEIMAIFGQWYGYTVQVTDPNILQQQFTGSFNRQEPLEDLLSIICDVNNINYHVNQEQKLVTLSRK